VSNSASSSEPVGPRVPFGLRRPRTAAALVFLGVLAVYHVNGKVLQQQDCMPAPYTAWTLVRRASHDLREHEYLQPRCDWNTNTGGPVRELPDGRWISRFPPGSAWSAMPLFAPLALFTDHASRASVMRRMGKLAAALYVAGAVVLFYFLCLELAPSAALLATVCFAFGTNLWSVAAQALWMHGPALFWVMLALFLVLRRDKAPGPWRSIAIGLALAMAIVTRPTTGLFALATIAAFACRGGWRAAGLTVAGMAPPLVALAVYNLEFFGRISAGGYTGAESLWTTPLWLGLAGLLIAPSRGLLVYSLPLVLAPWGLAGIRSTGSHRPAILWLWSGAAAVTILVYAKFVWWWGGWSFGPRYLIEILPVLCLLFALAYTRMRMRIWKNAAIALVVLACVVHALGVFGHQSHWYARHANPGQGQIFFELQDTQIEAHARRLVERMREDRN
jgi:hypothetical protein